MPPRIKYWLGEVLWLGLGVPVIFLGLLWLADALSNAVGM